MSSELRDWVADKIPDLANGDWAQVSGDASFRQYFRLSNARRSVIAVFAPPEQEDNQRFIRVQALLAQNGVPVPRLLAQDLERGYMLQSDFGDRLLLDELNQESADQRYEQAMRLLLTLQQVDPPADFPRYDLAFVSDESELFKQWFVGGLLDYQLDEQEVESLTELDKVFFANGLEQPQVLVHRDFHSRNVMCLDDGSLGLIDFQDALMGPITYDLVSLLRDCYISWPEERVEAWVKQFRSKAFEGRLMSIVDDEGFMRWFDLTGLQRHIKVLGIFARLHLRDGKSAYLDDLNQVLEYTLNVSKRHRALAPFHEWFQRILMPRIRQQSWYREPVE